MGHKHLFVRREGEDNACLCGTILCMSVSPVNRFHCNLKKGHKGLCRNFRHPEGMRWKKLREPCDGQKPFEIELEKQPIIILVEGRKSGREVCLVCLKGQPATVVIGQTTDEAIGHLVRNHQEEFNLKVMWK